MECEVASALELLLERDELQCADDVRELVAPSQAEIPQMEAPTVNLDDYDALLEQREIGQ